MTDRLMPCPFCGREQHNPLEAGHADDCYFTLHDKLKREMEESNCYSVPDVLAAWNRRATPETQPLAPCAAVGDEASDWRTYWADEMQKKADKDKERGCLQPVSYYVRSAFIYAGVGRKS